MSRGDDGGEGADQLDMQQSPRVAEAIEVGLRNRPAANGRGCAGDSICVRHAALSVVRVAALAFPGNCRRRRNGITA